jgi:APA family basic amino acid/polyamine antiporter
VVHSGLAALLALSGTFGKLAILANVSVLTLYLFCAIAAGVLRQRDIRTEGEPFRAPGGPLIPVLACAAILSVLWATVTRREVLALVGVLVVASIIYGARAMRSPSVQVE